MKKLMMFLCLFQLTLGMAGTKDSGGDPYVQQFLNAALKVAYYLKENPYNQIINFDTQLFASEVELINLSILDESKEDLLEFSEERLFDKDGVEKPAVFNKETNKIKVNRDSWKSFNDEEKFVQIIMEFSGLIGAETRYQQAQALIEGNANIIKGIKLQNQDQKYLVPGWKIVGMDSSQFSNIQEEDLIDMGQLGDGSDYSATVLNFLKDPISSSHYETVLRIYNNWLVGKPTYLVFHTDGGQRAIITAIYLGAYDRKKNVIAYSLTLEKITQLYSGECAVNAQDLSPYDRVKNCYLNLNYFYPSELLNYEPLAEKATYDDAFNLLPKVTKGLHDQITRYMAFEIEQMREVARENFIQDYSSAAYAPGTENRIMVSTLKAHDFIPTLVGPFNGPSFWKLDKRSIRIFDQQARDKVAGIKLYQALKAIANDSLVYIDANISCNYDKDPNGYIRGPKLIERKLLKDLLSKKPCTHFFMNLDLESELYKQLDLSGYKFDTEKSAWVK